MTYELPVIITVPGIPVAKGSARAFVVRGRAVVTQSNLASQKPWASMITTTMAEAWKGKAVSTNPCSVSMFFTFPRPKSHFLTHGIRPNAPKHHRCKPDIDKLARLVLDALTGICWQDDSQVCHVEAFKCYGEKPGVQISVQEYINEEKE